MFWIYLCYGAVFRQIVEVHVCDEACSYFGRRERAVSVRSQKFGQLSCYEEMCVPQSVSEVTTDSTIIINKRSMFDALATKTARAVSAMNYVMKNLLLHEDPSRGRLCSRLARYPGVIASTENWKEAAFKTGNVLGWKQRHEWSRERVRVQLLRLL